MANRLLESGGLRLLESGGVRLLEPLVPPDPYPISLTIRERGHTATHEDEFTATHRERHTARHDEKFHTATHRERKSIDFEEGH